jgi:hypothetical protein
LLGASLSRSYAASLFLKTATQAWGRAREVLHTFGYLKSMDFVLCQKNMDFADSKMVTIWFFIERSESSLAIMHA